MDDSSYGSASALVLLLGLSGVLCMFFSAYRLLSLHVLNGGRQCMCAIADTLLKGVRGCDGHSVAAPVRLTNRIVAMTRGPMMTRCVHTVCKSK